MFYPLNSLVMVANFELSERLRSFLSLGSSHKYLRLGAMFSVSIRRRYAFSQSMMIYPEANCVFFTAREIRYYMSLAEALDLDFDVTAENGVAVLEIVDYNVNNG